LKKRGGGSTADRGATKKKREENRGWHSIILAREETQKEGGSHSVKHSKSEVKEDQQDADSKKFEWFRH